MFGWKRKTRPDRAWPRLRKTEAPAPARPKVYRFGFNLNGMRLEWNFESETEKNSFAAGFREGIEYQLESMYRRGILKQRYSMDYEPLKQAPKKGVIV